MRAARSPRRQQFASENAAGRFDADAGKDLQDPAQKNSSAIFSYPSESEVLKAGREEEELEEALRAAYGRLRRASEVNKMLRGTLVDKKMASKELQKEILVLEQHIDCAREVELPARENSVREVEVLIREEQSKQQAVNLELGRGIMHREEHLGELSTVGQRLKDLGHRNKAMLKDQQAQIDERNKEIRDLLRHIQIVEGAEFCEQPAALMSTLERARSDMQAQRSGHFDSIDTEVGTNSELDLEESGTSSFPMLQPMLPLSTVARQFPAVPEGLSTVGAEGYRRLPGLDLGSLLGQTPAAEGPRE